MTSGLALFTDEPEIRKVSLDFPNYIKTISDLVLNSHHPYTIGIFGGWGTGKTTLMNKIERKLTHEGCRCIQFNAWRFSLEKQHATYPLMLTIISKLLSEKNVKEKIDSPAKRLKKTAARVIHGLKGNISFGMPGVVNADISIDPSAMNRITPDEELTAKELRDLSKSILLEGIDLINRLLDLVSGPRQNDSLKLVIFVDDLDRCTPEKAAEVFESIKIFFDIEGIVFVLGLSHEIVEAAINIKYKDFNGLFNGKDYLKKIIQVPFTLPPWTSDDAHQYLKDLLNDYKEYSYKSFFNENSDMIIQGIEYNPREIKRLLNNFILANLILKKNDRSAMQKLLSLQILSFRWKNIYDKIIVEPTNFRIIISKLNDSERINVDGSIKYQLPPDGESLENQILEDPALVRFLKGGAKIIPNISDKEWSVYRRATVIEPEVNVESKSRVQKELEEKEDVEIYQIPHIRKISPAKTHNFQKTGGAPNQGQMQSILAESIELYSDTLGLIQFKFISSRKQCSDFRIHVKIDNVEVDTTEWIGYPSREPPLPLDTEIMTISGLRPGRHLMTLQPEGRVGGCNQGYIHTWEGTIQLYQ